MVPEWRWALTVPLLLNVRLLPFAWPFFLSLSFSNFALSTWEEHRDYLGRVTNRVTSCLVLTHFLCAVNPAFVFHDRVKVKAYDDEWSVILFPALFSAGLWASRLLSFLFISFVSFILFKSDYLNVSAEDRKQTKGLMNFINWLCSLSGDKSTNRTWLW